MCEAEEFSDKNLLLFQKKQPTEANTNETVNTVKKNLSCKEQESI